MTSPLARRSRRLLALAAVSTLLVSCSDGGDEITLPSPSPTPATEAASPTAAATPSPGPSDAFAVPDEITAEYVERVLNEIQRHSAEVTRGILRGPVEESAQELPQTVQDDLAAIYEEPLLEFSRRGRLALLRSAEERRDLVEADDFGQQRVAVEAVLAEAPCVVARVTRDFTEVDADPDPDASTLAFVFLVRVDGANTTGWKLASLLESDVQAGSDDEEELRAFTANDVTGQAPEVCA